MQTTTMRGLALAFLLVCGITAFTVVPESRKSAFSTSSFGAPSAFQWASKSSTRLYVGTQLDFHQTLGVSLDASLHEIKSAYRKLAKKWHPDANPGKDTTEQFQEINLAYQVLTDPDKRKQMIGEMCNGSKQWVPSNESIEWPFQAKPWGKSGSDASSNHYTHGYHYSYGDEVDLGDHAYDSWFRGGDGTGYDTRSRGSRVRDDYVYRGVREREVMRHPTPPSPSVEEMFTGLSDRDMRPPAVEVGSDLRLDIDVSFKMSVLGGDRVIRMRHLETCSSCLGNCMPETVVTCRTCGGSGVVNEVLYNPFGHAEHSQHACSSCHGTGTAIKGGCDTCGGQGHVERVKEVRVRIPPGVQNGERLCMKGEGDAGRGGGPSGDLYIFLNVKDDPTFRQEGSDIYSEHTINYVDAILGGSIVISVVDGLATIDVPPGTQCGQVLRLPGNGATMIEDRSLRGDHFVTINVDIPHDVSIEDEELLRRLRQNKLNNLRP